MREAPGSAQAAQDLQANNAFYRRFWREHPLYSTPYPNAEEAARAARILELVAGLFETGELSSEGTRILDVGCGRGWLTGLLASFGEAEGCEPTPEAVEMARRFFPKLRFHAGTVADLMRQPEARGYDLLVSSEVLEHVPRAAKPGFVAELTAALRPQGFCILSTPRGELWDACGDSSSQLVEDWLSERELRVLFEGAGWRPVRHDRALATRATRLDRVVGRFKRILVRLGMEQPWPSLERALDYRSGLYQVWCFRRG